MAKMKSTFVLALACVLSGAGAEAQSCRTLDAVLAAAPKFESFKALPERIAHPAAVDLRGSKAARLFRTVLRAAAKDGPNFAGHVAIAGWGCGTGCLDWAAIDLKTGKVVFTAAAAPLANPSDDWDRNEEITRRYAAQGANKADFDELLFRRDSALIVTLGAPGGDEAKAGIAWWRWTGTRFARIAFVPSKSICRPG